MSRTLALARLTVLSVALAACARAHRTDDLVATATDDSAAVAARASEPVVLEFENNNWSDVVVYILHDGQATRFQLITATHTGELTVPPHLQGQGGVFRIAVRRVGGRDSYTSEPISTRIGHTVRLTIESDLRHSSVGVW
jgi:hypothetical protein